MWTLRGLNSTAADLRSRISEHRIEDLALVIVDPVYRLLAGRDENSASDIGDLLGKLAGIALDAGPVLLRPISRRGMPRRRMPKIGSRALVCSPGSRTAY